MSFSEVLIFLVCGFFSFVFLIKWYYYLLNGWPPGRNTPQKAVLACLPAVSLAVIIFTLKVLASFDVVNDFSYIFFYISMGFAWLYAGVMLMFVLFDMSWIDDVVHQGNKAELIAFSGGFLALTLIYSGANVGDGPGWWCVVFAGGLGLAAWFGLGLCVNMFTGVFERVSIGRDIFCGIRLCGYLLAGGIILARASAGDWTSFYMTVAEFLAGWPVLPLSVLAVLAERYFFSKAGSEGERNTLGYSLAAGAVYVLIAAVSVILMPLKESPLYGVTAGAFM